MKNPHSYIIETVASLSPDRLYAEAEICGSALSPGINGTTLFYRHTKENGVFVVSTVFGLPDNAGQGRYEMRICGGWFPPPLQRNESMNVLANGFRKNMMTLPNLYGNGGFAFSVFYTEEISRVDLLGRTISIFSKDSQCQNSSDALASGLILPA